ncbi:MAG: hypothetical protein LLG00_16190 [Planctomycetaceae bacterium]|nr:hypothetical protein [Planctomycetaceae bacterium]
MRLIVGLLRDDEAATAVEYAVMLMLILLAALASIALVGNKTAALWDTIAGGVGATQSSGH